MTSAWRAGVSALVGTLALVVGCSSPTPAPVAPPSTSTERYGAPEVDVKRDLGALATEPCRLLDAADLRSLRLTVAPRVRTTMLGYIECGWRDRETRQSVSLTPITGRDYLVDVYRTRGSTIFEPTEVDGLPAVRQQSDPMSTSCSLTVGLNSDQALVGDYFELTGRGSGQACERLQRVVELAVAKIPRAK